MKKTTIIISIMFLIICVVSVTGVSANVSSGISISFKDIGRRKVVDFNDIYTVTLKYTWCANMNNSETYEKPTGIIYISSEDIELETTEISDEEFWDDSYEDHSEHEIGLTLSRDMINNESGVVNFSIASYDSEGMCIAAGGSCLHYAVDGNKLCLSEYENEAESYFPRRKVIIEFVVILSTILLFSIIRYIRKWYDKYLWNKHTKEE